MTYARAYLAGGCSGGVKVRLLGSLMRRMINRTSLVDWRFADGRGGCTILFSYAKIKLVIITPREKAQG